MNHLQRGLIASIVLAVMCVGCGESEDTTGPADTINNGSEMPPENMQPSDQEATPEAASSDAPETGMVGDEELGENNTDEIETTDGAEAQTELPDIADILESDPRFSEVLELVNIIGLLDAMRGPGPFTVFVPVNDAVLSLPESTMDRVRDETGFLHQFILAHVAEGDHSAESLLSLDMIEMIGGEVSVDALADGEVFVGGAQVLEADIQARNGRLHALSQVIPIPSEADHSEAP